MENKQKSGAKKDGVVQAPFVQKEHRQKRVHCSVFMFGF